MAGFWTNQKEEELVDLWEERPELYAVGVALYTNRNARGNAIRSIATSLGISEAEAKKKMDNMRTQYCRYLKSPSGGYHTPRQQWFLRRLKFLELHMKKRPSTSNLDVQNDSTTSPEEGEDDDRGEEKEEEEQDREEEEEEENVQPSRVGKRRRKRRSDPAQAQDLTILGAINETLKVLTDTTTQHRHNLQPPKNDGIHAFCQYMEQQLRAIEDPHHLQYVQFQIHQILFSPRPSSSQYAPTYLFMYVVPKSN